MTASTLINATILKTLMFSWGRWVSCLNLELIAMQGCFLYGLLCQVFSVVPAILLVLVAINLNSVLIVNLNKFVILT